MEAVRLRLLFDDRRLLNKSQKSDGLKRSWILLKPELETISDFASHLIHTFDLYGACPNGLLLSMEGFNLPPFESTCILKDKDIIRVKKKRGASTDITGISDDADLLEDSQLVEKQSVLTGVKLLAAEEFEKESGGYLSEAEEDEYTLEEPLPVEKKSSGKRTSKKRKASVKLQKEKKKSRCTSVEKCSEVPSGGDNVVYDEQNDSCHQDKTLSRKNLLKKDKSTKENGKLTIESTSESSEEVNIIDESMPSKDRCGQSEANGTHKEDVTHILDGTKKFPSRSARRKKAKRQWLRELAKSQKNELIPRQTPEDDVLKKFPKHQEADQTSDVEDEFVPVVVKPGHIRFQSLDDDQGFQQNQDPVETFQWNGITSKRKGQKWGTEKTSSGRKNDEKDYDHNFTEKMTIQDKGLVHYPLDFDKLMLLSTLPKEGDIVAYRLVELSSSWCPELSSFRVGKVSWYNSASQRIMLVPVPEYPVVCDEKMVDEEASTPPQDTSLYNEDGSLEIEFASLVDVRIIKHGISDPPIAISGGIDDDDDHMSDQDAVTNVQPNINIEKIHAPIAENGGQVNLWEEISQALSEKKKELLHKDGWTKRESSGKSGWSFKALRSSALGPTMALLRAQNGS